LQETIEMLEQSGLAAPAPPEEHEYLAPADPEADVFQNSGVAVTGCEIFHFYDGFLIHAILLRVRYSVLIIISRNEG
jgi:hypothetical protein